MLGDEDPSGMVYLLSSGGDDVIDWCHVPRFRDILRILFASYKSHSFP